jgi:hypothetical protein
MRVMVVMKMSKANHEGTIAESRIDCQNKFASYHLLQNLTL